MDAAITHPDPADPVDGGPVATLVDDLAPLDTLLAVWAHPDDEAYLAGGIMAEAARRGARVVCVTATLGEHGTDDPDTHPPARLGAVRRRELSAALAALGVDELVTLGYEDGTCDRAPVALAARRLRTIIDETRPDAVVGFGADGVTGHPDHRAVAAWTRRAVADAGDRIPLLTAATGAAWPADLLAGMDEVGAFWPGYPDRRPPAHLRSVRLAGDRLDQKLRAVTAHRSQVGPLRRSLGADGYRRLLATEAFAPGNEAAARRLDAGPDRLAA